MLDSRSPPLPSANRHGKGTGSSSNTLVGWEGTLAPFRPPWDRMNPPTAPPPGPAPSCGPAHRAYGPPGERRPGRRSPLPQGLSGSTNQRAPCWPSATPAPLPLPPASASQNPRWRDPGSGVPRPEFSRFSALCCCRSVASSGVTAWEATPRPLAPRAPPPRRRIAVSSTNTASRGRTWCRATGPCHSGPMRGVSRDRGGGPGSPPRLAPPPPPPLLLAAHRTRVRGDPFQQVPSGLQGSLRRLLGFPPILPTPSLLSSLL